MDRGLVLVLCVALVVATRLVRKHVLPRRAGERLVASLCSGLGLVPLSIEHGKTALSGQITGCSVVVEVTRDGAALVKVPITERVLPGKLTIYETSSWS